MPSSKTTAQVSETRITPEIVREVAEAAQYIEQAVAILEDPLLRHPLHLENHPSTSLSTVHQLIHDAQRDTTKLTHEQIAFLLNYPNFSNHYDIEAAKISNPETATSLDTRDLYQETPFIDYKAFFAMTTEPQLYYEFCYAIGLAINNSRQNPMELEIEDLIGLGNEYLETGAELPIQFDFTSQINVRKEKGGERSLPYSHTLPRCLYANHTPDPRLLRNISERPNTVESPSGIISNSVNREMTSINKTKEGKRRERSVPHSYISIGAQTGEFLTEINAKLSKITNTEVFRPTSFVDIIDWWQRHPHYIRFELSRHRPRTYLDYINMGGHEWKGIPYHIGGASLEGDLSTATYVIDLCQKVFESIPMRDLRDIIVSDEKTLEAYRKLENKRDEIVMDQLDQLFNSDHDDLVKLILRSNRDFNLLVDKMIKEFGISKFDTPVSGIITKKEGGTKLTDEEIENLISYIVSNALDISELRENYSMEKINKLLEYISEKDRELLKRAFREKVSSADTFNQVANIESFITSIEERYPIPYYLLPYMKKRTSGYFEFRKSLIKHMVDNKCWGSFLESYRSINKSDLTKEVANIKKILKESDALESLRELRKTVYEYCRQHEEIEYFSKLKKNLEDIEKEIKILKDIERECNPGIEDIWEWLVYSNYFEQFLQNNIVGFEKLFLSPIVSQQWQEIAQKRGYSVFNDSYSYSFKDLSSVSRYRAQLVFNQLLKFWVENGKINRTDLSRVSPIATEVEPSIQIGANSPVDQVTSDSLDLDNILSRSLEESGLFPNESDETIKQIVGELLYARIPFKREDFLSTITGQKLLSIIQPSNDKDFFVIGELLNGKNVYDADRIDLLCKVLEEFESSLVKDLLNSDGAWDKLLYSNSGALIRAAIHNRLVPVSGRSHLPFNNVLSRIAILFAMKNFCNTTNGYLESQKSSLRIRKPKIGEKGKKVSIKSIAPLQLIHDHRINDKTLPRIGISSINLEPGRAEIFIGSAGSGKTTFMRSVALQLYLASIGVPGIFESLNGPKVGKVIVSLNSDESNESGSRFKNMVCRIADIIDEVIEHKKDKPGEKILVCLDELFRGTDDIGAVPLYQAVIDYFNKEDDVILITSTHYMLLKEVHDKGLAKGINFKSFDFQKHTITDELRESDISTVLAEMGYPSSFVQTFRGILDKKNSSIPIEIIVKDLRKSKVEIESSHERVIENSVDLGILEESEWEWAFKDAFRLNVKPDEYIKWLSIEDLTDKLYTRVLEFRKTAYDILADLEYEERSALEKLFVLTVTPRYQQQEKDFISAYESLRIYLKKNFHPIFSPLADFFTKKRSKIKEIENDFKNYFFILLNNHSLDSIKNIEAQNILIHSLLLNRERFYGRKKIDSEELADLIRKTIQDIQYASTTSRFVNINSSVYITDNAEGDNIEITNCFFPGQGAVPNSPRLDTSETTLNTFFVGNKPVCMVGDNSAGKTVSAKAIAFSVFTGVNGGFVFGKMKQPKARYIVRNVFSVKSSNFKSSSMDETSKVLKILVEALRDKKNKYLVVLDELGATVSSKEGSTFAALVIYLLTKSGHKVVVTTHYHHLFKILQELGIESDSYGFVYEEEKNTHFKAQKGLRPGSSRGVERSIDFVREHSRNLRNAKAIVEVFKSAILNRDELLKILNNE